MPDYEIFMAQVKAVGHDKRGNTIYRRNEEGEEILYPPEDQETIPLLERTATGDGTVRPLPRQKREDDDTEQVANEFIDWKKQVVLGW